MNELVFVYDRTQADVDRAKELYNIGWVNLTEAQKEEWLSGLRGCLNTADLSRIENNIFAISQLFDIQLQTNKDSVPDIPDVTYFEKLLENVAALRATGFIYLTTPAVPEKPVNTYQKVNDIERILRDIYSAYIANNTSRIYCGETYAGEYGLI